jgi:hypothetical protein
MCVLSKVKGEKKMSRTIEAINAAIKASAEKSTFIGRWVTDEEKEAICILKAAMERLSTITSHLPKYDDKDWVERLSEDDRALVLFFSINMTCEPIDVLEYIFTLASPYKQVVTSLAHHYFVLMAATEYDFARRHQLDLAASALSNKEASPRTHEIYMLAKANGIGPQYPLFG